MADWSFLDERFRALRGAVRIYDPSPFVSDHDTVRLGRDDDELWISVRVEDGKTTTAAQRKARCCLLHEALVLTSIVAVANYDAWRNALVSISDLGVPPTVDLGTPRRLQPQYLVELATVSRFTWTNAQQIIVNGHNNEAFREELAQATETASALGVKITDHVSPRVRVFDCPLGDDRPQQVARLRSMVKTIVALQRLENEPYSCATLRLDSISLLLQNFEIHSSVFMGILKVVETGVRISSLGLPFNFAEDEDEDDDVLQAWAFLVCAMCGRPQRPTQRPIRIDQLVLDTQYNYREFMLQLLTVVGESRSLKSLKISAGSPRGDPGGFFWLWLGVMLFRTDSKCSVEVLNLDMVSLSPLAIDNLRDAMTTADPMLLLWQRTTQTSDNEPISSSIRREITIPSGTTVQPYGDQPGTYLDDFTVPIDWSGIAIVDDPTKSAIDVLLFGVGFCEVERSSLSNKRTRVDTTVAMVHDDATTPTEHKIHRLLLGMLDGWDPGNENGSGVDSLLSLIGSPLTDLSLSDANLNDNVLARCLEHCPRLQSLKVEGARLATLTPIMQTYDRGGQISSLELSAISVKLQFRTAFEDFLKGFLRPSAMKRTLKKLRIGHQWAGFFSQSTADIMKQVLSDTLTLDYLHLYRWDGGLPVEWDATSHHGEVVPVAGLPPLKQRVAFASVIKHLWTKDRFSRLDFDAVATVLEYVGQTKRRVVISEGTARFPMRMGRALQ